MPDKRIDRWIQYIAKYAAAGKVYYKGFEMAHALGAYENPEYAEILDFQYRKATGQTGDITPALPLDMEPAVQEHPAVTVTDEPVLYEEKLDKMLFELSGTLSWRKLRKSDIDTIKKAGIKDYPEQYKKYLEIIRNYHARIKADEMNRKYGKAGARIEQWLSYIEENLDRYWYRKGEQVVLDMIQALEKEGYDASRHRVKLEDMRTAYAEKQEKKEKSRYVNRGGNNNRDNNRHINRVAAGINAFIAVYFILLFARLFG